ncbi:MAG: lamin tail domain-containing protein [Candidatus Heimdallarchaeota archaeon]
MLVIPLLSLVVNTNIVTAIDHIEFGVPVFNPGAINTYTFTGSRNVTCFAGPDAAYQMIYTSLARAQTSFYLEVYTLSSEALVNGLIAAQGRGVDVQVSLSHDRVSGFEDDYTEEAAYRLDQASVLVTWCSSGFAYTHAKFWIIDSQLTFVYSGNWAPTSIPQFEGARTNREMGFMFDDTAIATYYENVFFDDQALGTPYQGTEPHLGALQASETTGTYSHPFDDPYTVVASMEVTPVFAPDNSYTLLSNLIDSATTSIDVELQYIKYDCYLFDDLIDAAQRGVNVRVLIPEPGVSNENITQDLFDSGADVKFFDGLGHNHNKYINVDNEIVSVSSINWSNNSVVNNREAGAIVKNSDVAAYFKTVFDFDWANSDIPAGFEKPVTIIAPQAGEILTGVYNIILKFGAGTYDKVDINIAQKVEPSIGSIAHPEGTITHSYDFSDLDEGSYTLQAVVEPTVGDDIIAEVDFNVIHDEEIRIFISEVRYDADSEPAGEFFELYNDNAFNVTIGGWTFTDNEETYTVPLGTKISSEDLFIFARDESVFLSEMASLGVTDALVDIRYSDLLLANSGDELILKDPDNAIIDAVIWGSGTLSGHVAWTGSMNESVSLQRIPANTDTDDCSADFTTGTPDPGEVFVTVPPSGFIPGFIISTTITAVFVTSLGIRYLKRKK